MTQARGLRKLKPESSVSFNLFAGSTLPANFLNDYSDTHDEVQKFSEEVNHFEVNFTLVQEILEGLHGFDINKVNLNPQESILKEERDTWQLIESLIQLETQYFIALRGDEIKDGGKPRLAKWKPKIKSNPDNEVDDELRLIRKDKEYAQLDNPANSSVGSAFNVQTPLQIMV